MKSEMDRINTMREDRDYYEWNMERGGSFMQTMCGAMMRADSQNLQRIHRGFPRLVNGYVAYSHEVDWEGFIQMLKDNEQAIID